MRVYIASKYLAHESINNMIYKGLIDAGIEVFLPKSINIDAVTNEEMRLVGEKCFDGIDKCNIILAVEPFGKSVSSEIGYAICQKRNSIQKKWIILFSNSLNNVEVASDEVMINPFFDAVVCSIPELVSFIKTNVVEE